MTAAVSRVDFLLFMKGSTVNYTSFCLYKDCTDDQYRCEVPDTRVCIYNDELCDGYRDCGDGKDEDGCPSRSKSFGSFVYLFVWVVCVHRLNLLS